MVQGYTQQNSGSKGGWTSYLDSRRAEGGKPFSGTIIYRNEVLLCSYTCGVAHDQWTASLSKESKLSRIEATDRETGGSMLNVTGLSPDFVTHKVYFMCDEVRKYELFE